MIRLSVVALPTCDSNVVYKIIHFKLIILTHNKGFFFLAVLISLGISKINAQVQNDSIQKSSIDTLSANNNDEPEEETLEEQVSYTAEDSIVALINERKAFLYGKAKVNYGSMNIEAEVIELDYTKNLVTAYGKKDSLGKLFGTPVFKDAGQTMEADKIMYNLKTKRGKIFNALTHQGDLLVVGAEIKKDSTDIIYMKGMDCIPCQEADARTRFKATKAKIIPDDKIVTGPMYLEIGGVPTPLGLPFGYFPNTKEHHNGILFPTYTNHNRWGYGLTNGGFYWGISDQTDMVIHGDIYQNGSWSLSTQNNYYVLYKASGGIGLRYSQYNNGDRDIPSQFNKQIAYGVKWSHKQDNKNNPTMRFSANVDFAQNQAFSRVTADNSRDFLQSTNLSNIAFSKTFKRSSLSLNAMHNQNNITRDMSIVLPSLTFNVNRFFPFKRENATKQNVLDKLGVTYMAEAQNTLKGKDSSIFRGNILDSLNFGLRQSSSISTNFNILKYITVTPAINLAAQTYPNTIRKEFYLDTLYSKLDPTKDSVLLPRIRNQRVNDFATGFNGSFSTGLNTKVYFDYLFRKGKVKQIRHQMIPTLTYNYTPDFGASQFGFWRKVQKDTLGNQLDYSVFERGIYGGPGRGEVNGLGININNMIDAKLKQKTDTGTTYKKVALLQELSLNTFYNFAADSFRMNDISLSARTILFKNINLVYRSTFSPYLYDKNSNREINKFMIGNDDRIARLTDIVISIQSNIGSDMLAAAKKVKQTVDMSNNVEAGGSNDANSQEKLSWDLGITYNLTLQNHNDHRLQPSHFLSLVGSINPTKFWKVGVTTNYDFNNQKFEYTRLTIYRDLKCWQASASWVPFGRNKSYSISLNMKTSLLSSFKIPRERSYLDVFY